MKPLVLCLICTALPSCENADKGPKKATTNIIEESAEKLENTDSQEKLWDKERLLRELERIENPTPFESALAQSRSTTLARAFIIAKHADASVTITETIYGIAPSDPEAYIPRMRPSGHYLVGSIMPLGGYGIGYLRREERFCIDLTDDQRYLTGEGVSTMTSMDEIRTKINRRSEQASAGNP